MSHHDHEARLNDWFWGAGGSIQAIATIPGVVGVTGSLDAGVHVNTSAESPYRSLRRLGVSEVLDRLP
jgi:hypothetical protein